MSEDATRTETLAVKPEVDATPGDETTGPNLWLALLFAAVVLAVSLQNLWLRRRSAREQREASGTGA